MGATCLFQTPETWRKTPSKSKPENFATGRSAHPEVVGNGARRLRRFNLRRKPQPPDGGTFKRRPESGAANSESFTSRTGSTIVLGRAVPMDCRSGMIRHRTEV